MPKVLISVILYSISLASVCLASPSYYTFEGYTRSDINTYEWVYELGYEPDEYLNYVFLIEPEGIWPKDNIMVGNVHNKYKAEAVYINKNYSPSPFPLSYGISIIGLKSCTDCADVASVLDDVRVSGNGFIENWQVGMEVRFDDVWGYTASGSGGVYSFHMYNIGSGYLTSISPTFAPPSVPIPGSLILLSSGIFVIVSAHILPPKKTKPNQLGQRAGRFVAALRARILASR